MQRIEQQAVLLLDHGQDGLARHRRPAPEEGRHFLLLQHLLGGLRVERPIGGGIGHRDVDGATIDAASRVDLVGGHAHDIVERALEVRHRAGRRKETAELDRARGGARGAQQGGGADERGCAQACTLNEGPACHDAHGANLNLLSRGATPSRRPNGCNVKEQSIVLKGRGKCSRGRAIMAILPEWA